MKGSCVTPHAFESTEEIAIIEVQRALRTEQESENTVTVVQKLCVTVHVNIHSRYSGAVAHTLRSVGTNVKPSKEPEQRAMASNYTTFFVGVGIYRRISRL